MRTGKQRQREETAAETGETGVGGGNGSWYHNFEMTGNLGQQQEQQCAAAAGRCEMKCERQMGK